MEIKGVRTNHDLLPPRKRYPSPNQINISPSPKISPGAWWIYLFFYSLYVTNFVVSLKPPHICSRLLIYSAFSLYVNTALTGFANIPLFYFTDCFSVDQCLVCKKSSSASSTIFAESMLTVCIFMIYLIGLIYR